MIDVALQTQALLNRARLFALCHEARSRLNTALATGNFIGAAVGSAAATTLWSAALLLYLFESDSRRTTSLDAV